MPFLPLNQQRQSTEGTTYTNTACIAKLIENSEILRVQEPRYVKVTAATISTKDIKVFCSLATAGTVDKCRIKIVGYDLRVIAVGVVGVVTILGQHGRVFLKSVNHYQYSLNGRTPPYLSQHCIRVSSADTWRHLRSTNRHLFVVVHFQLNTYGRTQLLARWPGTLSRILSRIQRAAQTVLGVYLKCTCSRVISASSALWVHNDYALYKSTHSLTH